MINNTKAAGLIFCGFCDNMEVKIYLGAGLSAIGAIPVIGEVADAVKAAQKTIDDILWMD